MKSNCKCYVKSKSMMLAAMFGGLADDYPITFVENGMFVTIEASLIGTDVFSSALGTYQPMYNPNNTDNKPAIRVPATNAQLLDTFKKGDLREIRKSNFDALMTGQYVDMNKPLTSADSRELTMKKSHLQTEIQKGFKRKQIEKSEKKRKAQRSVKSQPTFSNKRM